MDCRLQKKRGVINQALFVELWALWCGPCKVVKQALEKLGHEYGGRVDLWEVNADDHPDLSRTLRVYGIPTLIAYRGDKEPVRYVGVKSVKTEPDAKNIAIGFAAPASEEQIKALLTEIEYPVAA